MYVEFGRDMKGRRLFGRSPLLRVSVKRGFTVQLSIILPQVKLPIKMLFCDSLYVCLAAGIKPLVHQHSSTISVSLLLIPVL